MIIRKDNYAGYGLQLQTLDSEAFITTIENGKIGAAGLDVIENEFDLYYYDHKSDILKNRELALLRS